MRKVKSRNGEEGWGLSIFVGQGNQGGEDTAKGGQGARVRNNERDRTLEERRELPWLICTDSKSNRERERER